VNGIIALVYGNQFVANHVPLEEGENTITATAADTDGNTVEISITVNAETTGDYITADTESGVSPVETTLSIEGSFTFADAPSLTYFGDMGTSYIALVRQSLRYR
jgi:glucodextranase-like protein